MTAKYRLAIKQSLPLIAYPIISQLLSFITVANRVTQAALKGQYVRWLFFIHGFATPGWGLFGGLFTIIYIIRIAKWKHFCSRCCGKKEEPITGKNATCRTTYQSERYTTYGITVINPTTYDIPNESEVDDEYVVIQNR